ncbi:MAG: 3-phosphoshikimate 1-carboxyvinyltransferase [Elusimicrobia bacterium]|nr:3-phosphoshikimate 1-carboxyvinyltransferase [Elusimicrobiota bacterium]
MIRIARPTRISGSIAVPGDKSISHRLLIFAALARGRSELAGLAPGRDVRRTLEALKKLGVAIEEENGRAVVLGREGCLAEPSAPLDCGNSGSTARLLCGALAAQPFFSVLFGDRSLSARPMARVARPLRSMGAGIWGRANAGFLPLAISGGRLEGASHTLEIASAQVKTALLLAGLAAEGVTRVREPARSRDHSERLLSFMGARISSRERDVCLRPSRLEAVRVAVPGDFSSAAAFAVLAVLHPRADLEIRRVNLNATRTGLLRVLLRMGARLDIEVERRRPEPVGRIRVRSSELRGVAVSPEDVPSLIDEIPLWALAATQAHGRSVIRGAAELRRKESDRLTATAACLRALGARVHELPDGLEIEGPTPLRAAAPGHFRDHRIVMMTAIAGALCREGVGVSGERWAAVSYPDFFPDLMRVMGS